jgi:hypothetical protein
VTGTPFIGLYPFQWIALLAAAMTLLLLADAFAGHYRSGFVFRSQYAPFISGGLLIVSAAVASIAPDLAWTKVALRVTGWLAVVSGVIGFGFHHYYGLAKKPGSYRWWLHHLLYGAPPLAPLGLTATGALALVAARGLAGEAHFAGVEIRVILLGFVAIALAGVILQAGILHYRGAFNNPAMYGPLAAPLLAVIACAWMIIAPGPSALPVLAVSLWLTFLTGFVGLGMHLRGMGRQVGGLYLTLFNWLEGPPAFAPALFTGLAGVGLVAIHLL